MKKNKTIIIIIVLVGVVLVSSMGIEAGFYEKIVSMYKSFIYCNG